MAYNMTQLASSDTIFKLVGYANDSTTGMVVIVLMLSVFFIMLMSMKRYDFPKAIMASSAISFVISLLLVYAELLNPLWALGFLILTAISLLISTTFE